MAASASVRLSAIQRPSSGPRRPFPAGGRSCGAHHQPGVDHSRNIVVFRSLKRQYSENDQVTAPRPARPTVQALVLGCPARIRAGLPAHRRGIAGLGRKVSPTTMWAIPKKAGMDPAPRRGDPTCALVSRTSGPSRLEHQLQPSESPPHPHDLSYSPGPIHVVDGGWVDGWMAASKRRQAPI
jgi:hypothetical protein